MNIFNVLGRKKREYYDYILVLGQSNMDGRAPIAGFDTQYRVSNPNFRLWNGTAEVAYSTPALAAWSWVLQHEWASMYPTKKINVIRVTQGGTACHAGDRWNVVGGTLLATTLDRINSLKIAKAAEGKIARCMGILWDQKESDVNFPTYVQYSNGVLSGDFVDTINAIKLSTGGNPWMIFAEQMENQSVGYPHQRLAMIAMQRLYAQYTPNAYLLPMNDNRASIPMDDLLHYNAVGTTFVAMLAKDVYINNNLSI